LEDALLPKLRHDIGGSYNRFDIMRVLVNRTPHRSLQDSMGAVRQSEQSASEEPAFNQRSESHMEGVD
jgi:hypothetical protein